MNTIILAAGGIDYRNMAQGLTSSPLLSAVNGRPAIVWVISDILKKTGDNITVVLNEDDAEMRHFFEMRYARHWRVNTKTIKNSQSIIHSIMTGLCDIKSGSVRVNLGDTLLMDTEYKTNDALYLSSFPFASQDWCLAEIKDEKIASFQNKKRGITGAEYKAVVGRYEFSSAKLLRDAANAAIEKQRREISDLLELYANEIIPIEVQKQNWIDFGHLSGLAKARIQLIESRNFNALKIHPILPEITKTSTNKKKISQEIYWYKNLPNELQSIAPRVLQEETDSIKMEYYGYGTLAEKFIYFNLPESFWESTLELLFSVVDLFKKHKAIDCQTNAANVYQVKTQNRLDELKSQGKDWVEILDAKTLTINGRSFSGLPDLQNFIQKRTSKITSSAQICVSHGDLCFNNILYDVPTGALKLIDPRGEFGGDRPSIYGDPRYDLAKLRHSFCGNYDCIIEGDFELSKEDGNYRLQIYKEKQKNREEIFDRVTRKFGYDTKDLRFIEALLFLSMIPLHSDGKDKQLAFFLIAIQKLNEVKEQ